MHHRTNGLDRLSLGKLGLGLGIVMLAALTLPMGAAPGNGDTTNAGVHDTFDRLKALEGRWYGEMNDGSPVELEYRLTGNGTSIVETFRKVQATDHDMLTVYHVDGEKLMLTHYCVAGNQPRMVANPGTDPNVIRFDFHDVTGTTSEGFMHHALIELRGDDEMHQDWTYRQQGEDVFSESIVYRRVR